MNFQFYMPTRIIMGENCINNNAAAIAALGKKALIVTGKHSAENNGSLKDVTQVLEKNAQQYVLFNRVMSNPTIDCVYEGAQIAKDHGVDFIIAIGGGSPMDAAKSIALLASQEIARQDLFSGKYGDKVLPMAFIPTTAGTGSEVTQYSILTNDAAQTKTTVASPALFPNIAFLDGKYMDALGLTTTINTAVDALSHAVEGMLSNRASQLTDMIAAQSIGKIASCFESLKSGNISTKDRQNLLYGSTLAGMVIAHTGTTAVHSMGYSLTYFRDIDHGRANGLLLAEFLKLVKCQCPEKIQQILSLMGYENIEAFEEIMNALLGEKEKMTLEEVEKFASIAIKAKNISNCIVVPTQEDLLKIYKTVFSV